MFMLRLARPARQWMYTVRRGDRSAVTTLRTAATITVSVAAENSAMACVAKRGCGRPAPGWLSVPPGPWPRPWPASRAALWVYPPISGPATLIQSVTPAWRSSGRLTPSFPHPSVRLPLGAAPMSTRPGTSQLHSLSGPPSPPTASVLSTGRPSASASTAPYSGCQVPSDCVDNARQWAVNAIASAHPRERCIPIGRMCRCATTREGNPTRKRLSLLLFVPALGPPRQWRPPLRVRVDVYRVHPAPPPSLAARPRVRLFRCLGVRRRHRGDRHRCRRLPP